MKKKLKILSLSLISFLFIQTSIAAVPGFGWVTGSGNVSKETRNLSHFDGIDIGGAFEIILIKANKSKIVLEMDDNLMDYVSTRIHGGVLKVETEKDFRKTTDLKLYIYFQDMDNIDLSGAATLYSDEVLSAPSLEIQASGASEMKLKLDTKELNADFSGASRINFSGKASQVDVEASGATVYKAIELETKNCRIDASGAAVARIWATEELSLEASGAASVRYKGSPSIDIIDISGASSVRKY